jgi:hypothetical protein
VRARGTATLRGAGVAEAVGVGVGVGEVFGVVFFGAFVQPKSEAAIKTAAIIPITLFICFLL